MQYNIDKIQIGNKAPQDTTVVVAMSGGVDSSVVAALLKTQGYNVLGVTLQLYDHGQAITKAKACCAGQDIYDAAQVAEKFGFPHYVLDYESVFKQDVIDDFADSYLRGETPIPCVKCNQSVKFRDLFKVAKDLKADALATGHYVRRIDVNNKAQLHKAVDNTKDQSYFLFAVTQEQLDYLHFPLGGITKQETRQLALDLGVEIANKPDSQDICFVPDGDYASLIRKLRPEAKKTGQIMHVDGFEMGKHEGIINYTIGQSKGLGLGYHEKLYVTKLDPDANIVYVGEEKDLEKTDFYIKDLNLFKQLEAGNSIEVKTRHNQSPKPAIYNGTKDGLAKVTMLVPEKAITPGQACVIYANDSQQVLGGGWIVRS